MLGSGARAKECKRLSYIVCLGDYGGEGRVLAGGVGQASLGTSKQYESIPQILSTNKQHIIYFSK